MMPHDFSPAALIRAIEENFIESWAQFGRSGGELRREDGLVRIVSAIPHIPYNGVLHTAWPSSAAADAGIAAQAEYFQSRGKQMIWTVTPSTQPPDLAARLVQHGFSLLYELAGMAADLDCLPETPPLPPGVEIREVDDLAGLRQYTDLVVRKWRLPPDCGEWIFDLHQQWGVGADKSRRRWLACKDNVPVAKVFLSLAAGAAGIYGVSTAPEVRRQGIGGSAGRRAGRIPHRRAAFHRHGKGRVSELGL